MSILSEKFTALKKSLPEGISIVAAAKTRSVEEITEVISAGAEIIGENYVQEAYYKKKNMGKYVDKASWHFIGHLQTNKVKKAVEIFDMIQTVDSVKIAKEIDKRSMQAKKIMPVLIEVNIAAEKEKSGVLPENVEILVDNIYNLKHIKIMGLMTMGPLAGNPEDARIFFTETKKIFNKLKDKNIENVEMKYLSMGMTNSYKIAIEEGSNMIRIGTAIFSKRRD